MGKSSSHLFKCMHAQIHNNLQSMHTHECLEMCHDLINQKPSCLCKCFGWAQTKRVLKSTSINLIRMNATMNQRSEMNAEKSKHSHIDIECLVHQHSTSAERWWLKITRCSFWMHPEWVKAAKELTNWKTQIDIVLSARILRLFKLKIRIVGIAIWFCVISRGSKCQRASEFVGQNRTELNTEHRVHTVGCFWKIVRHEIPNNHIEWMRHASCTERLSLVCSLIDAATISTTHNEHRRFHTHTNIFQAENTLWRWKTADYLSGL